MTSTRASNQQILLEFNAAKRRIGFLQTLASERRKEISKVWDLWQIHDPRGRAEAVELLRRVIPTAEVIGLMETFNRKWTDL